MIAIFNTKSNQEILREYNWVFKQHNTEMFTDFFVHFKSKVAELTARKVWQEEQLTETSLMHQFKSKLKLDLEEKLTEYLEEKEMDDRKLTLEDVFRIIARLAQQMLNRQTDKAITPIVPETPRCVRCNYCEQFGHVVKKFP
jgi:predicted house-cleaning noncanonical NTP pyrophosphatase (MazG superfamily)